VLEDEQKGQGLRDCPYGRNVGANLAFCPIYVPNLFCEGPIGMHVILLSARFTLQIHFREGVIEIDNDPFFGNAPDLLRV
jgi:hypothetical protein